MPSALKPIVPYSAGEVRRRRDVRPDRPGRPVEQLLVVSGHLMLAVGTEEQVLGPGDAAAFPGDRWHRYRAAPDTDRPVRFTLSVLQPSVGAVTPVPS